MMESVYCDFTQLPDDPSKKFKKLFPIHLFNLKISLKDFQKWIGYADVKSLPVHFYVQRNDSITKWRYGTPIPFDLARLNEGNAMNLTSGIFTAPRPGTYFFSFMGHARFPPSSETSYLLVQLAVCFYLNGDQIGAGMVDEGNTVVYQNSPLTLQSTLNLKSGDQVWVAIINMSNDEILDEDTEHLTHFTGFVLEEEIVSSF